MGIDKRMKEIVFSGINLFEAGPLSIYYDCLNTVKKLNIDKEYKITAFVHKKELFKDYQDYITIIELPQSRGSYLFRLYYEYIYFYRWSKNKKIDFWISLHDITPRVKAEKIYTYCHNPSPFMKKDLSKICFGIKNVAFSFFYKYLYRINIKSATAIVVQQEWMRKEFLRLYPIKNVIVARPNIDSSYDFSEKEKNDQKIIFVFPAFPRFFKNFDVICEASKDIRSNEYEIWLTLDGTENRYANQLVKKYGQDTCIKWLGILSRDEVFRLYNEADYLIFPSELETWGLPISEFKKTNKGVILADLPYAHETLGDYDMSVFFNPNKPEELREIIQNILLGKSVFSKHRIDIPEEPYAKNWDELINKIIK